MKTFSVKNDDCITAVEDFSERTVFVTALISMSTEVVHAHLSEMRDQNKTQKQKKKKKNPVVVSDLFRLASSSKHCFHSNLGSPKSSGFRLTLTVLKQVVAVNFDGIQSQLPSKFQRLYEDVVTGEETKHFYKLLVHVLLLPLVLLVQISRPV